jgi:small GTP-binding protein
MTEQVDHGRIKVVLIGSGSVGKTCIIQRSTTGTFVAGASPTLGVAAANQDVIVNGLPVHLSIMDTAGQEQYRSVTSSHVRDAAVALIVYSINDRNSFLDVDDWATFGNDNWRADTILFLVGNKLDLESQRLISVEDGSQKATDLGATFFETSALSGDGIENLFTAVAAQAAARPVPTTTTNEPTPAEKTEKGGCC